MKGDGVFRNWRVLGATVFSAVIVVAAYVIARGIEYPSLAQASDESALLEQLAARDSDNDGLPDWEEALYGTDPRMSDTRNLGMTDSQAVAQGLIVPKADTSLSSASTTPLIGVSPDPSLPVPAEGTITRALSQSLITAYSEALAKSPDGKLSDADIKAVTDTVLNEINTSLYPAPDFKRRTDLRTVPTDQDSLREFAIAAERVYTTNTAPVTKTALGYLKSYLEDGDSAALGQLPLLAKLYQDTAAGLAALPVPDELVDADLQMINALSQLGKVSEDFTRAETDPLATMLALRQYGEVIKRLGDAFIAVNLVYKKSAIQMAAGDPGSSYVGLVDRAVQEQKNKEAKP